MKFVMWSKTTILPRLGRVKVEVGPSEHDGEMIWAAYRCGSWDTQWQKVPCMSRQEVRAFPKTLAKWADGFWQRVTNQPEKI